jgi:hypothetical protein
MKLRRGHTAAMVAVAAAVTIIAAAADPVACSAA